MRKPHPAVAAVTSIALPKPIAAPVIAPLARVGAASPSGTIVRGVLAMGHAAAVNDRIELQLLIRAEVRAALAHHVALLRDPISLPMPTTGSVVEKRVRSTTAQMQIEQAVALEFGAGGVPSALKPGQRNKRLFDRMQRAPMSLKSAELPDERTLRRYFKKRTRPDKSPMSAGAG